MSHTTCALHCERHSTVLVLACLCLPQTSVRCAATCNILQGRTAREGTEGNAAGVAQVQHRYFLLVILTTSTGADLEEFRAALTGAAGELALSVIVVGIGSIDFEPLKA